ASDSRKVSTGTLSIQPAGARLSIAGNGGTGLINLLLFVVSSVQGLSGICDKFLPVRRFDTIFARRHLTAEFASLIMPLYSGRNTPGFHIPITVAGISLTSDSCAVANNAAPTSPPK